MAHRFFAGLGLFIFAGAALAPRAGWAYPEMVRHGYVNCISCHVNTNGGGVLTDYGRELSREILSTWGKDNEQESKFAYGLIPMPDWLVALGQYRGVYAYENTPYIQQGEYIYMQGDIEAAANPFKEWFYDLDVGYENKFNDTSALDHIIVRRAYVAYRPIETLSFQFGRFYTPFGIETPDHVIPIKRDMGWDEGQETINLEAAYIGEKYNLSITGNFGRPDYPSYHAEQGLSVVPAVVIGDTYKTGLTYYYGNGQDENRNVIGPWGILGFTPHFFLLTEWDLQQQSSKSGSFPSHFGGVNYQKLDYELIQGFHVYITQDFSQLDFSNFNTLANSYGAGIQFFPRPHFELNAEWQKLRMISVSDSYTDFAWLMLYIYI